MTDTNGNGKSGLPLGFATKDAITALVASSVGAGGGTYLTKYQIGELQQQIQQVQPIVVEQAKVIERQDELVKSVADLRMRLDGLSATQVQLVQTSDEAKTNGNRIDSLERRMERAERRIQEPPAPR